MTTFTTLRLRSLATLCAMVFSAGVAFAQDTAASSAKLDPPVKPTVTGKFIGDGKPAAIQFILVEEHEEFSGKPAVKLIFTEKDPSKAKKPSFDARFGKLGSALILSVHHDGGIFGCEVAHSAHSKSGFSSLGKIKMTDFKIAGGNVAGHVTTGGMLETFGQNWEVDLTFAAPLPAKLRTANVPAPKPAADAPANAPVEAPAKPAKTAAAPAIAVKSLPLPKDAKDVHYKELVKQIELTSAQPVAAVVGELSAALKRQGWKDGAGSLKGPKNAILKREMGDAKLTIMIQPSPAGSTVRIFAEGLNWEGAESGPPSPASDAAPEIDAIKKEADKALKDALKGLPKGL